MVNPDESFPKSVLSSENIQSAPFLSAPLSSWRALLIKEDWWAVWIGLAIVMIGVGLYANGATLRPLAVLPPRWTDFSSLIADFTANWPRYAGQFVFWLASLSLAGRALGYPLRDFARAFGLLYLAALIIFIISQWDRAVTYNLEAPLVALFVGLIIANTTPLPDWFKSALRVEFFVKIGIVLLGATVPFSLIVLAGPVAIVQAGVVSVATFLAIYAVGVRLGLERRFAATLGVGGAVCGVSAAIAVAGAVGAKREHVSVTIATVIIWAILMIFVLPLVARSLGLSTGVAGAWIGTSEFADAAGLAAAQAYGGYAGHSADIAGTSEQAILAFTLMKIIGRDVWIGIWAFVLALVATQFWDKDDATGAGKGAGADKAEIWRRFPKFVLGFLLASLLVSAVTAQLSLGTYNTTAVPRLIAPIKDMRTWAFIFSFLSIGLTTRFADLAKAGRTPMLAFSSGVLVNVILGFILSVYIFGQYWQTLGQ